MLGFGGRHWEVFLLNHMRWGCFVVLVSKCVVIGLCVRKSVHHLSITGARTDGWLTQLAEKKHQWKKKSVCSATKHNHTRNERVQIIDHAAV